MTTRVMQEITVRQNQISLSPLLPAARAGEQGSTGSTQHSSSCACTFCKEPVLLSDLPDKLRLLLSNRELIVTDSYWILGKERRKLLDNKVLFPFKFTFMILFIIISTLCLFAKRSDENLDLFPSSPHLNLQQHKNRPNLCLPLTDRSAWNPVQWVLRIFMVSKQQ